MWVQWKRMIKTHVSSSFIIIIISCNTNGQKLCRQGRPFIKWTERKCKSNGKKCLRALIVDVIFSSFLESRPHLIRLVHIRHVHYARGSLHSTASMSRRHQFVLCTSISSHKTLWLVRSCDHAHKIEMNGTEEEDEGKRSRKHTQNRDSQTEISVFFFVLQAFSFDDSFHFHCVGDSAAAATANYKFYGVFDFTMALP